MILDTEILFSVIIPIYNAKDTIERCLMPLLNIEKLDFEVILVDDGSTDGCGQVIQNMIKDNRKFHYFFKENSGAGATRNIGLSHSKGEYVVFVDSDDYILEEYLEKIPIILHEKKPDFVMFNYITKKNNEKIDNYRCCEKEQMISNSEQINNMRISFFGPDEFNRKFNRSIWNCVFRRKIIEENKIQFLNENEVFSEDTLFLIEFLKHVNKMVLLPEELYCHECYDDSLSQRYLDDNSLNRIKNLFYNQKKHLADFHISLQEDVEDKIKRMFVQNLMSITKKSFNTKNYKLIKTIRTDPFVQTLNINKLIRKYPIKNIFFWKCFFSPIYIIYYYLF